MKLVFIPAGEFMMGSRESAKDMAEFLNRMNHSHGETAAYGSRMEYACRAGTTTRYYWGDYPEWFAKVANVADAKALAKLRDWLTKADGCYRVTTPVGSFTPNTFGLYDMHRNAWQWCSDWYDAKYYAASPKIDPAGPYFGDVRVLRGGDWGRRLWESRSASRLWVKPDKPFFLTGFRVARTP
jgi:formylglycine-generating enzyme required for sulfatase activity